MPRPVKAMTAAEVGTLNRPERLSKTMRDPTLNWAPHELVTLDGLNPHAMSLSTTVGYNLIRQKYAAIW